METTFCNHLVNKEMALIGAFPEYCISNINGSISVLNVGKSRTSAVLPSFECYLPPGVRHHAARAQAGQAAGVRRGAAEPRGRHHRHQEVSWRVFLSTPHAVFVSPAASAGISTGLFTESQAYFGVFQDVRANAVGNLNTTLDGQVSRRVESGEGS